MALRQTLLSWLTQPGVAALDAALRERVSELLDSAPIVRRVELEALRERMDDARRELAARRAEIAALTQSIEAIAMEDDFLGDELLGSDALNGELDARYTELEEQIAITQNAGTAIAQQVTVTQAAVQEALTTAEKAIAIANSALATAEAASDGAAQLEAARGS
jgi:chromosome segregation ATPase